MYLMFLILYDSPTQIDDKGMPSKENMLSKINSTMPEEVMADLDMAMEKCVENHGKLFHISYAAYDSLVNII
jgi:hypothetical protein